MAREMNPSARGFTPGTMPPPIGYKATTDFIHSQAMQHVTPEQRQKRFHSFPFDSTPNGTRTPIAISGPSAWKMDPGFWEGLGEVFTGMDDLTA